MRDKARLHSCACGRASAWLTTLPSAPSLRLQPEEHLPSFRLRLGVLVLHQDTEYVQCFCHRRVNNAHSGHSPVCQSVKRTTTSRHNMLESSWRRIVGRAGVATTRQSTISEHLHADAAHPQGSAVYAALNARMSGSALIPGLPVPTADAGAMDAM